MKHLSTAVLFSVGAAAAAVSAALTLPSGYWVAPLTFAPLYMTYRTYKVYMARLEDEQQHVLNTSNLHLATIEALARAIDAKDRTTEMHIRRMQIYAAGLARAAGLTPAEIQGVTTAALLHDIGKLAVPEHILTKPGPLTQEEFQKIRIHPQMGADIIAGVRFLYPVAPLIKSHHERWDGTGYPQGLAGEQIPLGARIITVVDYFDAVSTERPYHKALSLDTAIGLLRREAGRALDPRLVPLFIDLLPSLTEAVARERQPTATAIASTAASVATNARVERGTAAGAGVGAGVEPASLGNAFEGIAIAHREIHALYDIAQSMGTSIGVPDTMALISSKLTRIVPWSSCALFLHQADTDSLTCRFSAGVDAPKLLNATLALGAGLAGAVVRDRRMLVNIDPQLVFDAANIPGDTELRSAMLCPLYFENAFIGCLALSHTEPSRYTEDHRRLLERVADQAGAVLHNSMVFEQTQEDSLTDPLTGLPNRRSLFAHLTRELARAERLKSEVAVIVLDIDGFKTINDTYGHHVGDAALREVSAALRASLRPYDLSVRYAGDEFIVVLDDCSFQAADGKRRELQERIEGLALEVRPGEILKIAASAGTAVYPKDGTSYEALVAQADQRMYRDKRERRDGAGAPHGETRPRRPPMDLPVEFPAELSVALPRELMDANETVPVAVPGPARREPVAPTLG